MAGDTLLFGAGIDLPNLARDVQRATGYFATFQRDVQRLLTRAQFTGDLSVQGRKAAATLLAGIQSTFNTKTANLREALARGVIDQRQFAIEGAKAAEAYNRELTAGMSALDAKKLLPRGLRQSLTGEFKEIGRTSGELMAEGIRERFEKLGGRLSAGGRALTVGVTAPLVAIAAVGLKSFQVLDDALDTVRITSGATGTALAGLEASFRKVFKDTPGDAETVAAAIAEVNRRTGATGAVLEDVARAQLTLARITKGDLTANLRESSKAFEQFGIQASGQVEALNFLFKLSQRTGIGFGELAGSLRQFGPQLRSIGFSFRQSAALIANFEKAGADAGEILSKLGVGLAKFGKAGLTAPQAFAALVDQIKRAKSESAAINLADNVFGGRGAAGFVAAVREGRVSFEQLLDEIGKSPETIAAAARATDGFQEQLQLLKQGLTTALAPIGTTLVTAFQKAAPAIENMGRTIAGLITSFSSLSPATQSFIIKAAVLGAALGPAVTALGGLVTAFATLAPVIVKAGAAIIGWSGTTAAIGFLLTPAGAVVAGLALLAAWYYKVSGAARQAKKDHEDYKNALSGVVDEGALFAQIGELRKGLAGAMRARQQLVNLQERSGLRTVKIRNESTGKDEWVDLLVAIRKADAQVAIYKEKIEDTRTAWDKVSAASRASAATAAASAKATADAISAAVGSGGGVTGSIEFDPAGAKKALDELKGRATALKAAFDDVRKGGAPIPELTAALLSTYDRANKLLSVQSDKFGEVGREIQAIIRTLRDTEPVDILREGKKLEVSVVPIIDKKALSAPITLTVPDLAGLKLPPIVIAGQSVKVQVTALERAVQTSAVALLKGARSVERFASTTGAGHGVITKFLQHVANGGESLAKTLLIASLRIPRAFSVAVDAVTLFSRGVFAAARGTIRAFGTIGRSIIDAINPVVIVGKFFSDAFGSLGTVFDKLKGPLSALSKILAEALAPIIDALIPVFRAILPVLRAFLQVLAPIITALIPIFQALVPLLEAVFPIIKAVAIAFTYLAQAALTVGAVILDVFGFVAKGFGYIIRGIAKAIDKLPGVSAKGAIRAGQAIIDFGVGLNKSADEFRKSAKAMAGARDQIRKTTIGGPIEESAEDTADAIDTLGAAARDTTEALLNVPQGFKIERARFRAAVAEFVESIADTIPAPVAPALVTKGATVAPMPNAADRGGVSGAGTIGRPSTAITFERVEITTTTADGAAVWRNLYGELTRLARQSGEAAQTAVLTLPRPA